MFTSPDFCKQTRTLLRSESIDGNLYSSNVTSDDGEEQSEEEDNDSDDDGEDRFDGANAIPWDGKSDTASYPPLSADKMKSGCDLRAAAAPMRSSIHTQRSPTTTHRSSHQRHSTGGVVMDKVVKEHQLRPIIGSMAEIVAKGNSSTLGDVKEYLHVKGRAIERRKTIRERESKPDSTPRHQNFAAYQAKYRKRENNNRHTHVLKHIQIYIVRKEQL
jgi:hypothetical protein